MTHIENKGTRGSPTKELSGVLALEALSPPAFAAVHRAGKVLHQPLPKTAS